MSGPGHPRDRTPAANQKPAQQPLTPTSPSSPHHHGQTMELIDEFFDEEDHSRKPLGEDDCFNHMMEFVREHSLDLITGLSTQDLEDQIRIQARIAAQLPIRMKYLSTEYAMPLAVMGLYDLAVLIDDSASMEFVESGKRKEALKNVLYFLARLYGTVSGETRGIKAIRFLNGKDHPNSDNLMKKDHIDEVIGDHKFEGLTRIGAALMKKILKPFVFTDDPPVKGTPRNMRQMDRPLLIMVITDGAVEGEKKEWLEIAIRSVVDALGAKGVGAKGVVFQFARVGNDEDAEAFLKELNEESPVKDYVDTLSGSDLMEVIGARTDAGDYKAEDLQTMIKLLLGPIDSTYDQLLRGEDSDEEADFDMY